MTTPTGSPAGRTPHDPLSDRRSRAVGNRNAGNVTAGAGAGNHAQDPGRSDEPSKQSRAAGPAVALVSGGTGALGQAICRTLARDGIDLAFSYRKKEDLAKERSAEIEAMGRRCLVGQVDGCDRAAVSEFCARVEQTFGQIDILVNNLGITQVMPFALIDEDDWDNMVQVNLKSMFLFSKAVARGMIRQRAGVILNLGSIAGHRLLEVPVHYATAKAGVTGFTVSLAKELSRYGVRVNEVCPGLIDAGIGTNVSERQMSEYTRYCSMGRPGTPQEVAELVAFLVSPKAAYINAQRVVIDGGL